MPDAEIGIDISRCELCIKDVVDAEVNVFTAVGKRKLRAENHSRATVLYSLFKEYDALLLPAASKMAYTTEEVKAEPTLCYEENKFTAPASITGLPALVACGVQFIANAFDEGKLMSIAEILEKEGK